jgi:hypothetical protein
MRSKSRMPQAAHGDACGGNPGPGAWMTACSEFILANPAKLPDWPKARAPPVLPGSRSQGYLRWAQVTAVTASGHHDIIAASSRPT